jgi:hypothetical protein
MTLEARCGSFQSEGSSASWFSSASRAFEASKSKMPPQQPDRPLDVLDHRLDFAAHDPIHRRIRGMCCDVSSRAIRRNAAIGTFLAIRVTRR